MASISPECTPFKTKYDQCFNQWYAQLLQNKTPPPSTSSQVIRPCSDLFEEYQKCVWNAIRSRDPSLEQLIQDAAQQTRLEEDPTFKSS